MDSLPMFQATVYQLSSQIKMPGIERDIFSMQSLRSLRFISSLLMESVILYLHLCLDLYYVTLACKVKFLSIGFNSQVVTWTCLGNFLDNNTEIVCYWLLDYFVASSPCLQFQYYSPMQILTTVNEL